MKTLTEIWGPEIRVLFRMRAELVRAQRAMPKVTAEAPAVEAAPPPPEPAPVMIPPSPDHIKTADERLAEFEKRRAADRARSKEEWRKTVEAIREPFTAKVKEKYRWGDERIIHVLTALDAIDRQRMGDIRRVVILKPEREGERPPQYSLKIGDFVCVVEYLTSLQQPERERRPDPRDRKGKPRRGKPPRRDASRPNSAPPRGRPQSPRKGPSHAPKNSS